MLSYCTNIHPAESWAETREALFTCVPRIRQELAAMDSPLKDLPLGIGLRLSARAAAELLATPHAAETLKSWLEDQGARVETLNGFPYGNFHGQRVKERVFQPDWTTPERFEYTCNLFRILALIGDEQADRLTVNHIVPIAVSYQNRLLENLLGLKEIFSPEEYEVLSADRKELIREISKRVTAIKVLVREMTEARKVANHMDSYKDKAFAYEENVRPYLEKIRDHIDHLEMEVDDEIWPLPKYRELLFTK